MMTRGGGAESFLGMTLTDMVPVIEAKLGRRFRRLEDIS